MTRRKALRPVSRVVHAPNVMFSAGLRRPSQQLEVLAILVRLRLWRMWGMGHCLGAAEQG